MKGHRVLLFLASVALLASVTPAAARRTRGTKEIGPGHFDRLDRAFLRGEPLDVRGRGSRVRARPASGHRAKEIGPGHFDRLDRAFLRRAAGRPGAGTKPAAHRGGSGPPE